MCLAHLSSVQGMCLYLRHQKIKEKKSHLQHRRITVYTIHPYVRLRISCFWIFVLFPCKTNISIFIYFLLSDILLFKKNVV